MNMAMQFREFIGSLRKRCGSNNRDIVPSFRAVRILWCRCGGHKIEGGYRGIPKSMNRGNDPPAWNSIPTRKSGLRRTCCWFGSRGRVGTEGSDLSRFSTPPLDFHSITSLTLHLNPDSVLSQSIVLILYSFGLKGPNNGEFLFYDL